MRALRWSRLNALRSSLREFNGINLDGLDRYEGPDEMRFAVTRKFSLDKSRWNNRVYGAEFRGSGYKAQCIKNAS